MRALLWALWIALATPAAVQDPLKWTLVPAAPDASLDPFCLSHLRPSHEISLSYSAKEDNTIFATANFRQLVGTVVLEHSGFVQHVACTPDTIELSFHSTSALDEARNHIAEGAIIVTNHATCNPESERGIYVVANAWERSGEVQLTARVFYTSWEEASESMEITYKKALDGSPPGDNARGRFDLAKRQSCVVSLVSRPRGFPTCGTTGIIRRPEMLRVYRAAGSPKTCARNCLNDKSCSSFSYSRALNTCITFKKSVKSQSFKKQYVGLSMYDRSCWQMRGSCGLAMTSSSTPSSTTSTTTTSAASSTPVAPAATTSSSSSSTSTSSSSSSTISTPSAEQPSSSSSSSSSSSDLSSTSTLSTPSPEPSSSASSSSSSSSSSSTSPDTSTPSLAPAELYTFSLFNEGVTYNPDGNIQLQLGSNAVLQPTIEMDPFQPDNAEVQERLRGLIAAGGFSSFEELSSTTLVDLESVGSGAFDGLPRNVQEKLPSGFAFSSAPRRRDWSPTPLNESMPHERDLGGFIVGEMLDFLGIQDMIDEWIDGKLRAICPVCADAYAFFVCATDPKCVLEVGAENGCRPCEAILRTNPFWALHEVKEYGMNTLKWALKYGMYPPGQSPVPPPDPPGPPPIEGAQMLTTVFDLALPERSTLETSPGYLECRNCGVSVDQMVIYGSVAVSFQEKKVLKAEFTLDVSSKSNMDLTLTLPSAARVKGSRGFGTSYGHAMEMKGVFLIQVAYSHLISYDIGGNKMNLNFGIATETTGAHAKMDLRSADLIEATGWESTYTVTYPSIDYGTQLSGYVAMQGVLTMNCDIMGTTYKDINLFGTETRYALAIGQSICGESCTNVDTMIQGYNRVRGHVVANIKDGGRRKMNIPFAPPPPPEPEFCGGFTQGGEVTQGAEKYNIVCGKSLQGSMNPNHQSQGITSFTNCIAQCNTYEDCVAAEWFDARKTCNLWRTVSGEGLNAAVNKVSVYASRLTFPAKPAPPPSPTVCPDRANKGLVFAESYAPPYHYPQAPYVDFVKPADAPASPIPASYPARNPTGYCNGTVDGPFNFDFIHQSESTTWDLQCGTTIDWTGQALVYYDGQDARGCSYMCIRKFPDCEAFMMHPVMGCTLLSNPKAQRYTTSENITVGLLANWGSYWTTKGLVEACKCPGNVCT